MYKVHYTGWLEDGTKFDSSVDRDQPFEFQQGLHRVINGWDDGFEGMRVGGKRRLFIPWQLAYGAQGRGPIPAKANLIFDIELIDQRDLNAPAPTPR
jgi:peptidylprolyl isomerase